MKRPLLGVLAWAALAAAAEASLPTVTFEPIAPAAPARKSAGTAPMAAPPAVAPERAVADTPANEPIDERPLWRLLQAKRHGELRRTIAALRASHPGWRPPAQMVTLLGEAEATSAVRRAIASRNPRQVLRLAAAWPRLFDATHLDARWAYLDALAATGQQAQARAVLSATLRAPLKPGDRLATLQKAAAWLSPEALDAQVAVALAASPSGRAAIQAWWGAGRLARLGTALRNADDPEALRLAEQLAPDIGARHDAKGALSLGWLRYRQTQFAESRTWFASAAAWAGRDATTRNEAKVGLVLAHLGLGQLGEAERHLKALSASEPRRAELQRSLFLRQATRAYADGQHAACLQALTRAQALAPLSPDAQVLQGWATLGLKRIAEAERRTRAIPASARGRAELWRAVLTAKANDALAASRPEAALGAIAELEREGPLTNEAVALKAWVLYRQGEFERAAELFAAAFDEEPKPETADGLYYSATRAGRGEWLESRLGDPVLAGRVKSLRAQAHFDRGQFALAHAEAPERYPQLAGYDDPSLTLGLSRRDRSGDPGLGRFQVTRAPEAEIRFQLSPADTWRLGFDRLLFDNGSLPPNAQLGSVPQAPAPYVPGFAAGPTHGFEPTIGYEHAGEHTFAAAIGLTPLDGPLPSAPTAEVSYRSQDALGEGALRGFSRAVTDSRLSYTGVRDPYEGGVWGRVTRTGVSLDREYALTPSDRLGGELQLDYLQGVGVADNDHAALALRWRRAFHPFGLDFQEASWGLEGFLESYRNNLSAFTRGSGGYFSPQLHSKLRWGVELKSRDFKPFQFQAKLGVGPGYAWGESAPYFPLAPDGRMLPGYDRFTIYYDADVRAVAHITDAIQAGGRVTLYRNVGYDEHVFSLFARALLGPRPGVVSGDLPE